MRNLFVLIALLFFSLGVNAQLFKKPVLTGMYVQWGYNRDAFSRSNLHFRDGDKYDFVVHNARALDQPDYQTFWESPIDITIPQNSFRAGLYLNKAQTHAIEINFDHAKYVVPDNQRLRITGHIYGESFDRDTNIERYFIHLEHTNGANFWHLNYVGQHELLHNKKRKLLTTVWKAGAGVTIPRSDVILLGKRQDNIYHIAGYIISIEAGLRYYISKHFFAELTGKTGHANYLNVLTIDGAKMSHHFYYGEAIGLIGYEFNFRKKK